MLADTALYHGAWRESLWNVIVVENFTLDELAKRILSMLSKDSSKLGLESINRGGRNKLSFLYRDLTHILTEVFDKLYEDELVIIEWISKVASKGIETVYENLKLILCRSTKLQFLFIRHWMKTA